jgi:hypothetical protein
VKTINVRINSPGGDVFEGDAIYSALAQHSATINVFIDGLPRQPRLISRWPATRSRSPSTPNS